MILNKKKKIPAEALTYKSLKPGSLPYIWQYIRHNTGAMFGMIFIGTLIVASAVSPYVLKYDYATID